MDLKKFQIDPLELYKFLELKKKKILFHANTLATSCTFIKEEGLISRGAVEKSGLFQTVQKSDDLDKKYGIWDDIFLDSTDICSRSGIPNHYGPILFELSTELLKDPSIRSVMITRYNPTKWASLEPENRYLINETFRKEYLIGDFDQMITLQCKMGILPLPKYLKIIRIDGLNIESFRNDHIELYSYCRGALRYAMDYDKYSFEWDKRMCGPSLIKKYEMLEFDELIKRFKATAK